MGGGLAGQIVEERGCAGRGCSEGGAGVGALVIIEGMKEGDVVGAGVVAGVVSTVAFVAPLVSSFSACSRVFSSRNS